MLNNFPLSYEDQAKLLNDGWTLVQASKKHKQIITLSPNGECETESMDTQTDVGIRANYIADSREKHYVSIDGFARKPSIAALVNAGYMIIRQRPNASLIVYCTGFGSWRALERIDAGTSMESAMKEMLKDSKTIHG